MSTLSQSESFNQAMQRIEQMYADLGRRMQELKLLIEQEITKRSQFQNNLTENVHRQSEASSDFLGFAAWREQDSVNPFQNTYPEKTQFSLPKLFGILDDLAGHAKDTIPLIRCWRDDSVNGECQLHLLIENFGATNVGWFINQFKNLIEIKPANCYTIKMHRSGVSRLIFENELRSTMFGLISSSQRSFYMGRPYNQFQQHSSPDHWTECRPNVIGFRLTQPTESQVNYQQNLSSTPRRWDGNNPWCMILECLEKFKDYRMRRVVILSQIGPQSQYSLCFVKTDEMMPVGDFIEHLKHIAVNDFAGFWQIKWAEHGKESADQVVISHQTLKNKLTELVQKPEVKETPTSSPAYFNVGDMLQHLSRFAKETGMTMSKSTVELFYLHYDYQNNHFVIMRDDSTTSISLNRLKKIFMKKIEQLDKEIRNYKIPMAATIRVSLGDDITTGSVKSVKEMIDLITTYPKTV